MNRRKDQIFHQQVEDFRLAMLGLAQCRDDIRKLARRVDRGFKRVQAGLEAHQQQLQLIWEELGKTPPAA